MGQQRGWTRDELLVALRLYLFTPFGKLHQKNPEIIDLARRLGRTPSALGMKACNFAGLDPEFLRTNRKGLSGAANADRAIWAEFTADSESIAAQAEDAFARLQGSTALPDVDILHMPAGATDILRLVRVRRVQSFFRAAVLTSYGSRCAISGLSIPELLVASHIIPWGHNVARRADPTNGICLNALFDRAFDRGLITLDEDLRVVVSRQLRAAITSANLRCSLDEVAGRVIQPLRLTPDPSALAYHRAHVFQA